MYNRCACVPVKQTAGDSGSPLHQEYKQPLSQPTTHSRVKLGNAPGLVQLLGMSPADNMQRQRQLCWLQGPCLLSRLAAVAKPPLSVAQSAASCAMERYGRQATPDSSLLSIQSC